MLETRDQFFPRHGGSSELADNDRAGVIGDLGRFDRRGVAASARVNKRDGGVARAGNIEDLPRFRRNVMRRFVLLKKHHALLRRE